MPEVAAETGVYVYGVVPGGHPPGDLPDGLDGRPVELVEHEEIAAAVSEVLVDRPPGRRAELMAHSAVLDALAQAGPVVPVQFGSVMEDRESVVTDLLAPDRERFGALLERLRNTRQFDLRVSYRDQQGLVEVLGTHPEIAELQRRTRNLPEGAVHPDLVRLGELVSRAMEGKRAEDAEDVWEVLAPQVIASSPRTVSGIDDVMEVAILVADDAVPGLEDSLETLAEAVHERMRVRLMGPTAPYDFVEEAAWA